MGIVNKEVKYAKEVGDCGVAVEQLVRDIKSGKTVTDIVAGSLKNLMDAVNGIDQVDDEFTADRGAAISTMCYHAGGIVDALLPAPKVSE